MDFAKGMSAVVVGFGAVTAALAQSAQPAPANVNPAVLKVNGQVVYAAEISIMMQSVSDHVQQGKSNAGEQDLLNVATQRVIEQRLLAQEARRFGLQPDAERVAAMVAAAEQRAGGSAALQKNLQAAGSSVDQFEALLKEMELSRVFIQRQIRPTIQINAEDVADFYRDNTSLFESGEQIRARHIVFQLPENAAADAVAAARQRAEAARRRALAGEDFGELARELSEGPTASTGGELGWFGREGMDSSFANAVFSVPNGEISEVVRSAFGFHVILVEDRRSAGTRLFEEVEDEARSMLINQRTAATVAGLLETLRKNAKIEFLMQDQ